MDNTITNGRIDQSLHVSLAGKFFATILSYLFHPVFVPLYVTYFLCYLHPSAFSGFSDGQRKQVMLIIGLNTVFFPLLSIVLLRALGFVQSIKLTSQRDRIIPYIACGIFFFWTYTIFKEQSQYPHLLTSFILGIFLASSAGLIANIYFKISMHAMGVGGWIGIMLLILWQNSMLMTWPLAIVLIIAGSVCTARLVLSDHKPLDIYGGLAVGLLTQFAAAMVVS